VRVRLADVGIWRSGGTPPKDRDELWGGGFPWISTRDLKQPELSESTETITEDAAYRFSTTVPAGSLLIGTRGMALAKRLPVAMATRAVAFNQDIKAIEPHRAVWSKYLLYALLAFENPILALTDEAAHGTKRLDTDLLRAFRIPCPSLAEQRAVAGFLDAEIGRIDEMIRVRSRQRLLLEERWSASLRTAVTPGGADDWTVFKLGREFCTGSGTTPSTERPEFYGEDVPWLNTGDLTDGAVVLARRGVTDRALAEHSALVVYPAGALVMAMYGATIGKLGMTSRPTTVNQACCVLHSPRRMDPWFAFFWLRSFRADIIALASGGGQPNISQEAVRNLRVPAPPLDEQRDIAARLRRQRGSLDAVIAAIDRQIALLRERRQALITAAVTGKLQVPTTATSSAAT